MAKKPASKRTHTKNDRRGNDAPGHKQGIARLQSVKIFGGQLRTSTTGSVAKLVLPTPVDRVFDYLIPKPLAAHVSRGCRAVVSFGKRKKLTGYVVDIVDSSPLAPPQLKPLLELPDDKPLLDEGMLRLTRWMSEYYACSWGEALECVLPAVIRRGHAKRTVGVLRLARSREECAAHANTLEEQAGPSPNSPLRKQAKVLKTLLAFNKDFRPSRLAEELGYSISPMNTLRKGGWVKIARIPVEDDADIAGLPPADGPVELTIEQERAVASLLPVIDRDEYATCLIKGVTGSGKTEIYIRALAHTLAAGKSGIVLVPEIALTPQTVRRFSERLGLTTGIAVLHSAMTDIERRREWGRIVAGEARVVIGPRSAVFAPVRDLGLIVVDEEHEPGYKQDNTPRYHARDVAVMRCFQQKALCILGSATPALESAFNAAAGRYRLIELKRRVADRRMPRMVVIDMADECRRQHKFAHLSDALIRGTADALESGHQAMMFLNRRGYQTFFQCDSCRNVLMCPNCEVPMSLHRAGGMALCHYCYETAAKPRGCTFCRVGTMTPLGVGTELLEEELIQRFPGAKVGRMDSDTMKKRSDYETILDAFREGEIDVLVGTQMLAKGLDFPNVTVVGVVHADLNLYLADFRAQERTFQLLTQVAGRAGRGDAPGAVFVQTFTPDHPCIEAARAQDYWAFYTHEAAQRRVASYPPYARIVNITVEARDARRGQELAKTIKAETDDLSRREQGRILQVLGPATAPIRKLRGRHRFQILIKVRDHESMAVVCGELRKHAKSSETLRVILDVDPYSLL